MKPPGIASGKGVERHDQQHGHRAQALDIGPVSI
jgi:hypothetical protein